MFLKPSSVEANNEQHFFNAVLLTIYASLFHLHKDLVMQLSYHFTLTVHEPQSQAPHHIVQYQLGVLDLME